jgi:hypothetical protein
MIQQPVGVDVSLQSRRVEDDTCMVMMIAYILEQGVDSTL